jgi:sulfite oxidase
VVKDLSKFRLTLDGVEAGGSTIELNMNDLMKLPQHEVIATIQCSGNRRAGMNEVKKASGSPWVQGM